MCCLNQAVFCLGRVSPCKWFVRELTWSPHCSPHSGKAPCFPRSLTFRTVPSSLQAVVPFLALPSQEVKLEPWVAIPLLLSLCRRTESPCQPSADFSHVELGGGAGCVQLVK